MGHLRMSLHVLASCGGGQKKLFLFNWIYYIPDDVITDFTKETGIEVVVDSYASNEEMYNKIVAGGSGYDLIVPSGDYVSIMIAEKLLEPIDKSKLKNFGNLDPAAIARIGFDVGNTHSVPYMMGAAGVSVNKTKVTGYEHSWSIFDKTDLKGRMTMLDDMREVLGAALKSLGIPSTIPARPISRKPASSSSAGSPTSSSSTPNRSPRASPQANSGSCRATRRTSSSSIPRTSVPTWTSSSPRKAPRCTWTACVS